MRYFLICSDQDTLTGLRLSGIEGAIAENNRELERLISAVRADETIAILIVDSVCAALNPALITELKLSAHRPLLTVIPGASGSPLLGDSIIDLIREAIGIRL